jgi:hypothetical protein
MSSLADRSASFVVRFWREQRDPETAPLEWRGSVECVTCRRRVYFKDVVKMLEFMERHVKRIGVDVTSTPAVRGSEATPGEGKTEISPAGKKRP